MYDDIKNPSILKLISSRHGNFQLYQSYLKNSKPTQATQLSTICILIVPGFQAFNQYNLPPSCYVFKLLNNTNLWLHIPPLSGGMTAISSLSDRLSLAFSPTNSSFKARITMSCMLSKLKPRTTWSLSSAELSGVGSSSWASRRPASSRAFAKNRILTRALLLLLWLSSPLISDSRRGHVAVTAGRHRYLPFSFSRRRVVRARTYTYARVLYNEREAADYIW